MSSGAALTSSRIACKDRGPAWSATTRGAEGLPAPGRAFGGEWQQCEKQRQAVGSTPLPNLNVFRGEGSSRGGFFSFSGGTHGEDDSFDGAGIVVGARWPGLPDGAHGAGAEGDEPPGKGPLHFSPGHARGRDRLPGARLRRMDQAPGQDLRRG